MVVSYGGGTETTTHASFLPYLELPLLGLGVLRKDVEDEGRAVQHLDACLLPPKAVLQVHLSCQGGGKGKKKKKKVTTRHGWDPWGQDGRGGTIRIHAALRERGRDSNPEPFIHYLLGRGQLLVHDDGPAAEARHLRLDLRHLPGADAGPGVEVVHLFFCPPQKQTSSDGRMDESLAPSEDSVHPPAHSFVRSLTRLLIGGARHLQPRRAHQLAQLRQGLLHAELRRLGVARV